MTNHAIRMKMHLSSKDIQSIENLQNICDAAQACNLKLELDFKRAAGTESGCSIEEVNEFLYEVDDVIVSYLGICHFGGNAAELNGMTHPDWRRKGIFTRLLALAAVESKRRGFRKILLLTDEKSASGKAFIQQKGAVYDNSEYRMKLENPTYEAKSAKVRLAVAEKSDRIGIVEMDAVFFGDLFPDVAALSKQPPEVPVM